MKKQKIILISVLSVVLAIVILLAVLFGAVFTLRHVEVVFVPLSAETEEENKTIVANSLNLEDVSIEDYIIKLANFKMGKSIFALNTQQVSSKLEKEIPYLKVNRITAKNVTTMQIRVRARHEMFAYSHSDNGYILDEELKVLKIVDIAELDNYNLIKINPVKRKDTATEQIQLTDNLLDANDSVESGDFLGSSYYKDIFANLYKSMYSTVKIPDGEQTKYVDRQDIISILNQVDFKTGYVNDRLVLKVAIQNFNYTVDIHIPNENLLNKINTTFSLINNLIGDNINNATVRYYPDGTGTDVCDYFLEN